MTERMRVIAEVEGVRTPTRKRSPKEVEQIFADHDKKRAAKKSLAKKSAKKAVTAKSAAKSAKVAKADLATAKAGAKTASTTKSVAPIPMNHVSPTGFIREVGFDEQGKMIHIGFKGSTWASASDKDEWNKVEKAIADPAVDFDTWYRKEFRGRFPQMVAVRKSTEVSA